MHTETAFRMLRVDFSLDDVPVWLQAAHASGRLRMHEDDEWASHCAGYIDGKRVNWGDYIISDGEDTFDVLHADMIAASDAEV